MEAVEIEYNDPWFKANAHDMISWFDPETFDWSYCWLLAKYCFKDFELWWDKDKFIWNHARYLWDTDKFDWNYSSHLIEYCWDYRDIWSRDISGRYALFNHLKGNHGFLPVLKVKADGEFIRW